MTEKTSVSFGIRLREALSLYFFFFRIGWFAFGGGWSIVAQIQKEFVDRRSDLTEEELLDLVSVGRSIPGTMITNTSYLFGASRGGLLCALASTLGIATPSFLLIAVLTYFYDALRDNIWIDRALVGVRAAVVPIIITAALRLRKGALTHPICYATCIIGCVLSLFFHANNVLIILAGVLIGLLSKQKGEDRS